VATTEAVPIAGDERADELAAKIGILRDALDRRGLGGIRLRGQDWFAWATCGGSNAILLASEDGAAEVFVTSTGAWVLTDTIEASRLRAEEVPEGLEVVEFGWTRPDEREDFVRQTVGGRSLASDRPLQNEASLPNEVVNEKRRLRPGEIARYRQLGLPAAQAVTTTLEQIAPGMTELDVAGIGASEMLVRGMDPALILVAGSRRLARYRHPRPTLAPIGDRVGVVFCARRHGLYANLTRFAYLRRPTSTERADARAVAEVEAAAWEASRPGTTLGAVFAAIAGAYARSGHAGAELDHHQGGTTGYLSREAIATPGSPVQLVTPVALAWNPSLPGIKIEDTVLLSDEGVEILTVDPAWPTVEVAGARRPDLLVRG
jgi:Xaa-Pro aminopeptidase